MIDAPIRRHREMIRPDWIDYNGHMNVAYYVLVFDHATDVLLDLMGLGEAYARDTGCSTFALQALVSYRQELRLGDTALVETQLIDYDAKRIHYFHRMIHEREGYVAATLEQISIHVDLNARRSAPLPDVALYRVEEVMASHRRLPAPPELGARIGIRR